MNASEGNYGKQNNLEREKHTLYDITSMYNLKNPEWPLAGAGVKELERYWSKSINV